MKKHVVCNGPKAFLTDFGFRQIGMPKTGLVHFSDIHCTACVLSKEIYIVQEEQEGYKTASAVVNPMWNRLLLF